MSTSNIVKAFKKEQLSSTDNRILQFKDQSKAIEHAWCVKWIKAFCSTRDPQAWMKRRLNTSLRLKAIDA